MGRCQQLGSQREGVGMPRSRASGGVQEPEGAAGRRVVGRAAARDEKSKGD